MSLTHEANGISNFLTLPNQKASENAEFYKASFFFIWI